MTNSTSSPIDRLTPFVIKLRSFRAIVHGHVELLLGRHSHPDWLQALDRCYAAFGIPGWQWRAYRPLTARIQAAFRRVAEAIAVSWGWLPITTDPYAWLADHCQYFYRPRNMEGAA